MEITHYRTALCSFVAVSASVLKLPNHNHTQSVAVLTRMASSMLFGQTDPAASVLRDCSPSNKTEEDRKNKTRFPEQKEANNNG